MDYLKELNKEQLEAVKNTEGPILVLAGAGSGKTKTVITRTAYIIDSKLAKPKEILVVTFTKKAAREMLERGMALLGEDNSEKPEFTTFHSWGYQFLRDNDLSSVGLHSNLTILDSADEKNILKMIALRIIEDDKDMLKDFTSKDFLSFLTLVKNNLIDSDSDVEEISMGMVKLLQASNGNFEFIEDNVEIAARIYKDYKEYLREQNSVDFDDLITIPIKLLKNNISLQNLYRNKYKYIMVDEYQDTNTSQIELLKLILNKKINICVVGDDAQSIYSWRGAKISYILNFKYKKIVNLSINYRSSRKIISTANNVLSSFENKHKDKEDLQAFHKDNGVVRMEEFFSAKEEAIFIARKIKELIRKGNEAKDFAILYRKKMLVREIEIQLIQKRIPYKISGGMALLDRKLLRGITHFLKFIANPDNIYAFSAYLELIIPSGALEKIAFASDGDVYNFLMKKEYEKIPRIQKETKRKIEAVLTDVKHMNELLKDKKLSFKTIIEKFIKNSALREEYATYDKNGNDEKEIQREINENLLNTYILIASNSDSLESFLEMISLDREESEGDINEVNLMTIHASKGLEFKYVFFCGVADNIIPSNLAKEYGGVEEEKRLFYVAVTRAKKGLYMTMAKKYPFMRQEDAVPSPFVSCLHSE